MHSGNSEIKVYHLQAPDRDKPIKLYVRLVGEDERVMVRVGGGWADLGDYLKEYAIHHGRRSASDTKGLADSKVLTPSEVLNSSPRLRFDDISLRSSPAPSSPVADIPIRADSPSSRAPPPALANRKVRGPGSNLAVNSLQASDGNLFRRKTDALTPGVPGSERSVSMTSVKSGTFVDDEDDVDSGLRSEDGSPSVGLGGPRRNVELSPTKQAWVEGMLNQASRQASVEKDKEKEKERERAKFGDLGKIGGTRRLFMRGKKGQGGS